MESVKSYRDIELKEEGVLPFLKDFKKVLEFYLDGQVNEEELADFAIRTFVVNETLSDSIENIDPEILELRRAMDITHPEWNQEKRVKYIKSLIKTANRLIKKHS
jgi:hypothetical protein